MPGPVDPVHGMFGHGGGILMVIGTVQVVADLPLEAGGPEIFTEKSDKFFINQRRGQKGGIPQ